MNFFFVKEVESRGKNEYSFAGRNNQFRNLPFFRLVKFVGEIPTRCIEWLITRIPKLNPIWAATVPVDNLASVTSLYLRDH